MFTEEPTSSNMLLLTLHRTSHSDSHFSRRQWLLRQVCLRHIQPLANHLFVHLAEITMYEALTRQYEPFSPSDNGPSSVQDIITRLKDVVEKKDSRRLQQIERAKAKKDPQEKSGIDAKEGQEQTKPEGEEAQDDNVEEVEERPAKKARLDPDAESTAEAPKDSATANKPPPVIKDNTRRDKRKSKMITDAAVLRPMPQLRGHTSYLTFATLMPLPKQVNGTATVKEVASTEKPVEPKEEEANTQTKVTSATNGLKKTESLVQLADEGKCAQPSIAESR